MSRRIRYHPALLKFVQTHNLKDRLENIIEILGDEAQNILEWALAEAQHRLYEEDYENSDPEVSSSVLFGEMLYHLIGHEAAIRLVIDNYNKGRMTTKEEVRHRTGQDIDMPTLYHDAGLRHPQEGRNLRHNIFHDAFMKLVRKYFSDSEISIPAIGKGLSPDLIIRHREPDWTLAVEYKGYRWMTLLSESEILKGMRYQAEWGSAWLVTTATKCVRDQYQRELDSEVLVEQGLQRLRRLLKRKAYTTEQREARGIARKGITHLEKHINERITCPLINAQDLLDSCLSGVPLRGLAVSTGFELVELFQREELFEAVEDILRVMKISTHQLYSDRVSSVRLIDKI